jgi:hypothetical protein
MRRPNGRLPGPPVEAARPAAIVVLIVVGALGLAFMMAGVYAIMVGAKAGVTFRILGGHVKGASVGEGLVAVGFVVEVMLFRAILQYLQHLEKPTTPADR